ncbi:GNAT family N-acetyltransferase [Methanosphaerula subterraneus]|uniref:GNAT family N-acetyltransferase n=1 Tax=Methanosphaerula subterraneus TaxID=3350244 RepID=UPI003F878715
MVRIIQSPWAIPAAGSPPRSIKEFIGREASGTDRLSIAHIQCPAGWREPGQRLQFDEYFVVLSGTLVITTQTEVLHASAGQAVIVPAGEWVQYSTAEKTDIISVCIPAPSSGRVNRDEKKPEPGPSEDYQIDFGEYGIDGLSLIEPLWTMLRDHHARVSQHFRSEHEFRTFAERCQELLEKNCGRTMMVHIARETSSGEVIGYCVSSAAPGDYGEVESIYVHPSFRVHKIGTTFMERASSWMEEVGVTGSRVMVFEGNEEVFPFYARFGFHPHRHLLTRQHEKEQ